jgi:hypothetical protein
MLPYYPPQKKTAERRGSSARRELAVSWRSREKTCACRSLSLLERPPELRPLCAAAFAQPCHGSWSCPDRCDCKAGIGSALVEPLRRAGALVGRPAGASLSVVSLLPSEKVRASPLTVADGSPQEVSCELLERSQASAEVYGRGRHHAGVPNGP